MLPLFPAARRCAAVVAVLAMAVTPPAPASAANRSLSFYLSQRETFQPVDTLTWCGDCVSADYLSATPWVVNPGPCMYDSDDDYKYTSTGNVFAAGGTFSFTDCRWNVVQDQDAFVFTDIVSASPNLAVTATFTWDTGSATYAIPAQPNGNDYEYHGCIRNAYPYGGTDVSVPGSNGGHGIYQRITFTISNPTKRSTTRTGGFLGAGNIDYYNAAHCPT